MVENQVKFLILSFRARSPMFNNPSSHNLRHAIAAMAHGVIIKFIGIMEFSFFFLKIDERLFSIESK